MEQSLHSLAPLQSGQSDQLVQVRQTSVLVVSDDFHTRQQLVGLVRKLNYRPLRARSVQEAARALWQSPSLIIVDHRVHGGDGIAWIKWLREQSVEAGKKHYLSLPVIYCSNVNCSERNFNLLRNLLGVAVIVKKPLDANLLSNQIEQLAAPPNVLQFNPPLRGEEMVDSLGQAQQEELETRNALEDLGQSYLGDMPAILYELRNHIVATAVEGNEAARLQAAITIAHNVKGTAGTFGFRELSDMSASIEKLLRQYKFDAGAVSCEQIADALIVVAEIEMWLEDCQDRHGLVFNDDWGDQNNCEQQDLTSIKFSPKPYKLTLPPPSLRESVSRVKGKLSDVFIEIGAGASSIHAQAAMPALPEVDLREAALPEDALPEAALPELALPQAARPEAIKAEPPLATAVPTPPALPVSEFFKSAPAAAASRSSRSSSSSSSSSSSEPTVQNLIPNVTPIITSYAHVHVQPSTAPEVGEEMEIEAEIGKRALIIGAKDVTESEMLHRALVGQSNWQVESIAGGIKALCRIDESAPALLILECSGEGDDLNGLDFCRMIRCHPKWTDLRIIMLTDDTSLACRQAIFKCGADDFIVKPLIEEELLISLRALARGKS